MASTLLKLSGRIEEERMCPERWWLRLYEKPVSSTKCLATTSSKNIWTPTSNVLASLATARGRCRSAVGKTAQLSGKPMLRGDVWRMVRRHASDAGIETAIGCHTFGATGIGDYLTNGGRIEVAQRVAGHSNAKATGLYDRRNDERQRRGRREDRNLTRQPTLQFLSKLRTGTHIFGLQAGQAPEHLDI
jgi:integrase/recombinase XerD